MLCSVYTEYVPCNMCVQVADKEMAEAKLELSKSNKEIEKLDLELSKLRSECDRVEEENHKLSGECMALRLHSLLSVYTLCSQSTLSTLRLHCVLSGYTVCSHLGWSKDDVRMFLVDNVR